MACLRILYKLYAYLLLGRIETTLDAAQPEEQHGFRSGRRIEETMLTASLVIERALAVTMPIWIISSNLSKAFDRVDWPALWRALADQGFNPHIIWNLQCAYCEQMGQVRGDSGDSRSFEILGVRQGCVLSARLFTAVLQWAMSRWRRKVQGHGINLDDGGANLIDLRFADDLLLFAKTAAEASWLLDTLVVELGAVGLILNAKKTVALTSEAQPAACLETPGGIKIRVLSRGEGHRWLGCILSTTGLEGFTAAAEFHLQAASRAFYANRWIPCDKRVSTIDQLRFSAP